MLHLAELEFPFAGHVRLGQRIGMHRGKKLEERLRLGRRDELALLTLEVFLVDQTVDRIGAGRRRPEPALFHRLGHLLVVDQFAGALHRGKQRRFGVARRRFRRLGVQLGRNGLRLRVVSAR